MPASSVYNKLNEANLITWMYLSFMGNIGIIVRHPPTPDSKMADYQTGSSYISETETDENKIPNTKYMFRGGRFGWPPFWTAVVDTPSYVIVQSTVKLLGDNHWFTPLTLQEFSLNVAASTIIFYFRSISSHLGFWRRIAQLLMTSHCSRITSWYNCHAASLYL